MNGRRFFLFFGIPFLIAPWVFSFGGSPIGSPEQRSLVSNIGIGLLIAAVACGSAEGRAERAPKGPVQQQWPMQPPPPQQQWPVQGQQPPGSWPSS